MSEWNADALDDDADDDEDGGDGRWGKVLEVNTRGNGNSFISTSGINPNSIYLMVSRAEPSRVVYEVDLPALHNTISSTTATTTMPLLVLKKFSPQSHTMGSSTNLN